MKKKDFMHNSYKRIEMELKRMLNGLNQRNNIQGYLKCASSSGKDHFLFLNQCAPLLVGIKPAVYLMIITEKRSVWEEHIKAYGLKCDCFYYGSVRSGVFIYNQKILSQHLLKNDVRDFFYQNGYREMNLSSIFTKLKEKLISYYEHKTEFPHEIGILLGYPVCDVLGYMKDQGESSIYSGYWKVYDHKDEMIQLFRSYDQAREGLLCNFMKNNIVNIDIKRRICHIQSRK